MPTITSLDGAFGAQVHGLDLSASTGEDTVRILARRGGDD